MLRLGRWCGELHYGTVWEDAIVSFIGYLRGCKGNWVKMSPLKNSSKMQFDDETPTKLWLIVTMRFALLHLICQTELH